MINTTYNAGKSPSKSFSTTKFSLKASINGLKFCILTKMTKLKNNIPALVTVGHMRNKTKEMSGKIRQPFA